MLLVERAGAGCFKNFWVPPDSFSVVRTGSARCCELAVIGVDEVPDELRNPKEALGL